MGEGSDDPLAATTALPSQPITGEEPTAAPSPISGLEPTRAAAIRLGDHPSLVEVERSHYTFDGEIARGGMGRIMRAHDRRLGREVAVKELLDATPAARLRFEREARITGRLQHPAIVSIYEAGVFASGEPFYAMKLVAGDSLEKMMARTEAGARMGLLPTILAISDALAYAHSRKVIHRDLKPHNVIVGEFGETVVIDWGLAKDLSSTAVDDASSPPRDRYNAGEGETVEGSVMGTPAYMPREQAAGDAVDERADVYAIGAILYKALSGASPYIGPSAADILVAVLAGPPTPLQRLVPDIPPDLLTIVDKAMARERDDRYPSAKELADDLRRYTTGQLVGAHRYTATERVRRWLRRHRTVATVSAVFLAVLLGFGAYSIDRIVSERDEAQRQEAAAVKSGAEAIARRGAAEDLTQFLLTEFRDKLAPIGKLDLLGSIGERVAGHYDALAPTVELDATALRRRAAAMLVLADVAVMHGDVPGAVRACNSGLAAIGKPRDLEGRILEVRLHIQLGHAHKTGQFELAEQDLTRALELARAVVADHPKERTARRVLGEALYTMGDVMEERGRAAQVVAVYREAVALFAALAKEDPGDPEIARSSGRAMQRLGALGMWLGELDEGGRQLLAARARQEQTLVARPTDVRIRRDLYITLWELGQLQALKRDYDTMLATWRAALEQAEWLLAREPESSRYQDDVIITLARIGEVLVHYNKPDEATTLLKRAVAMGEAQIARSPNNGRSKRLLADSLGGLADVHTARGDHDGSVALRERAVTLVTEVVGENPREAADCKKLAGVLALLGKEQLARREHAKALPVFRRAIELQQRAVAAEPKKVDWAIWAQAFRRGEALALLGLGDRDGARAALASAIAALEPWLTHRPDHVELRGELALIFADAARVAEPAAAPPLWKRVVDVLGPLDGQIKPDYRAALLEARKRSP